MADQRRLDLRRPQAVPGNFDVIVYAATDTELGVLVAFGRVTGGVAARVLAPVRADVALVIAVERARHGRRGLLEHQITFGIVWDGVAMFVDNFGFLPKERRC